jgi:hypothetical protein
MPSVRPISISLPGQTPADEFSTLNHELAHELLHRGECRSATSKRIRETKAEATAFVVASAIGLETGSASSDCNSCGRRRPHRESFVHLTPRIAPSRSAHPYLNEKRASTKKGHEEIWNNHISGRVGQIQSRKFRTVNASRMLKAFADENDLGKTTLQL